MAETVRVGGQSYLKRSPLGALGWLVIVPPFISVYNTSLHVAQMQDRYDVRGRISPAINVLLLLVIGVGTGIYTQEHLNRVWDAASGTSASRAPLPPPPDA